MEDSVCMVSALAYPPYLVGLSVSVTWETDPLNMAKLHLAENMRSVFADIPLVNCFSNMPYPVGNNPHAWAWPGADVSTVTLECRQEWQSYKLSVSEIVTSRQVTVFGRTSVWTTLEFLCGATKWVSRVLSKTRCPSLPVVVWQWSLAQNSGNVQSQPPSPAVSSTRKKYFVVFCVVRNMDEFAWSVDARKSEAGQFAAWRINGCIAYR